MLLVVVALVVEAVAIAISPLVVAPKLYFIKLAQAADKPQTATSQAQARNLAEVVPWHYWDDGKENGNYYSILGLYRDNGQVHGNYYMVTP